MAKAGKVKESEQERALTEIAGQQLQDYQARWEPLQMAAAGKIEEMGKANSWERQMAKGQVAAENRANFSATADKVDAAQTNSGAGIGSGRFMANESGVADDQARSTGMGIQKADTAIDRAYTQGLSNLMSIGRGEKASANDSFAQLAQSGAQEAQGNAMDSAQRRSDAMATAGMALGAGTAAMSRPQQNPFQSVTSAQAGQAGSAGWQYGLRTGSNGGDVLYG